MTKAGQQAGPIRDETGQDDLTVVTRPWVPRAEDGARAVLVSERHALFLRKSAEAIVDDEIEHAGVMGPVPADWTWDLVHCRLVAVHALFQRLPGARIPSEYRSFWEDLQPREVSRVQKPLTAAENELVDWTWDRLFCWSEIDRAVLMGVMSGKSLATVSKITLAIASRHGGAGIGKTAVHKRYRRNTTTMAQEWNAAAIVIDAATRECWLNNFSRKP